MSSMKGSQSSISRDRKMATKHHENTLKTHGELLSIKITSYRRPNNTHTHTHTHTHTCLPCYIWCLLMKK